MMCSETCEFEMSQRILSDITNATLGMLCSLVPFSNPSSATVIALLGPQASSPATVARNKLERTNAGEDACGPRRAIAVAREGLLKGNVR